MGRPIFTPEELAELAVMLGICQQTLSNWENGIGAPGDIMERLAAVNREVST